MIRRVIFLAASLTTASLSAAPEFARTEVLREDVQNLFGSRPSEFVAFKFAAQFDRKTACDLVVEHRAHTGAPWQIVERRTEIPQRSVQITLSVDSRPGMRPPGEGLLVRMTWGFGDAHEGGWGSRIAVLPGPIGEYRLEAAAETNELLRFATTRAGDYRIRVEPKPEN